MILVVLEQGSSCALMNTWSLKSMLMQSRMSLSKNGWAEGVGQQYPMSLSSTPRPSSWRIRQGNSGNAQDNLRSQKQKATTYLQPRKRRELAYCFLLYRVVAIEPSRTRCGKTRNCFARHLCVEFQILSDDRFSHSELLNIDNTCQSPTDRPGRSVRGERAKFTRLVPGFIEAKFWK